MNKKAAVLCVGFEEQFVVCLKSKKFRGGDEQESSTHTVVRKVAQKKCRGFL